jgi:hypothetical protein
MVLTAEAIGTGVYQDDSRGKVYTYEDMATHVTIVVNLVDEDIPNKQYCYACMWAHLKRMIDLMGPPDEGPPDINQGDGETADPELHEVPTEADVQEASSPISPFRDTFKPHSFPLDVVPDRRFE